MRMNFVDDKRLQWDILWSPGPVTDSKTNWIPLCLFCFERTVMKHNIPFWGPTSYNEGIWPPGTGQIINVCVISLVCWRWLLELLFSLQSPCCNLECGTYFREGDRELFWKCVNCCNMVCAMSAVCPAEPPPPHSGQGGSLVCISS